MSTRGPRTLADTLAAHRGRAAASFEVAGEGFSALVGNDLVAAADAYRAGLERLPAPLRTAFCEHQRQLADQAGEWLRKYNRNLYSRVRGYWQLGVELGFEYPWPVVAILGICQVLGGMARARFYGLLGVAAAQLRYDRLEKLADATDDILRRTNRAIFHDSVPTVLYAVHCHRLRKSGQATLASALETGPLPPLFDEDSRHLIRALVSGLAIANSADRFRALSQLTMRHFDREQAVFSHHMGVDRSRTYEPSAGWLGMMTKISAVPSPQIVGKQGHRRLEFHDFAMPAGFDIRNHDSRVAAFGAAFVQSVTATSSDYRVALDYVHHRFAKDETAPNPGYMR